MMVVVMLIGVDGGDGVSNTNVDMSPNRMPGGDAVSASGSYGRRREAKAAPTRGPTGEGDEGHAGHPGVLLA